MGDVDGTVLKAYKVRWPIVGIAKRVTYAIGQDKKVLWAFRNERNMTVHAARACEFVSGVTT